MKQKFTQKKNPHQLTIKQHIFPSCSISRFCNENGFVDLLMLEDQKRKLFKPNNEIFCVRRSWDERSESGYGKQIEDDFQAVMGRVLQCESLDSEGDFRSITSFYCLWRTRRYWSKKNMEDEALGVLPELKYSLNQQEELEKAHICVIRPDGTIAGSTMRGLMMNKTLNTYRESMRGVKWGILKASEGEFLVPDNFPDGCIPLSPKLLLAAGCDSQTIDLPTLQESNSLALSSAERYVFARNLNECPTLSDELFDLI